MSESSSKPITISIFSFVMITSAVVLSVRTLPMTASVGMLTVTLTMLSALCFLVPSSLVAAELATTYPEDGGMFVWVGKAFGERLGFVAVWLQWVQMIFGMTSIMMVIATSLAYVFDPALATNKHFVLAVILVVYWVCTLLNMNGMKTLGWLSTLSVIIGVYIPFIVLLIGAGIYLFAGHPLKTDFSFTTQNLFPQHVDMSTLAIFIGFVFVTMGMEASASNVTSLQNPKRNYPIAIIWVALIMVILSVFGSFAIMVGIAPKDISMTSGLMQVFDYYFGMLHIGWMTKLMALCLSIGMIGQINSWVLGPVRGLQVTAEHKLLPPVMRKHNAHGVPTTLVLLQATLISIVGLLITTMNNVDNFYMILMSLVGQTYLAAYLLMFAAAIWLRYKDPAAQRPFMIHGGKTAGMWIISGLGILTSLVAGYLGFFAPSGYHGSSSGYSWFVLGGLVIMVVIPFIVYAWGQHAKRQELKTQQALN